MRFIRQLKLFWTDTKGGMTVEAAIIIPILFWAYGALFVYFEAFAAKNTELKANYTVSDILSRKTDGVTQSYLDGLHKLYAYLNLQRPDESWLRVTTIRCLSKCTNDDERVLVIDWSKSSGAGSQDLTNDDIETYKPAIPLFASGDLQVMVESSAKHRPILSENLTGIGQKTFASLVVTRPRFGPQLNWDTSVGDPDADIDDGQVADGGGSGEGGPQVDPNGESGSGDDD